jgi:hypothetical protein
MVAFGGIYIALSGSVVLDHCVKDANMLRAPLWEVYSPPLNERGCRVRLDCKTA